MQVSTPVRETPVFASSVLNNVEDEQTRVSMGFVEVEDEKKVLPGELIENYI